MKAWIIKRRRGGSRVDNWAMRLALSRRSRRLGDCSANE